MSRDTRTLRKEKRYFKPDAKIQEDCEVKTRSIVLLPFELALAFVENISSDVRGGLDALTGTKTYSLPPVVRIPSFNVHFHLFLTR